MKAVFFDRDNTLIKDKNYMHKVEDLDFYHDSFSALKKILKKGFKLFIITNQSGIGRGFFNEDDMHVFHKAMLEEFKKNSITFIDLKFCPHSPDDRCSCRKPSPKLVLECINQYEINIKESYMIGDKIIDAECGEAAGITGVTINCKSESKYNDFKSLTEFADFLYL
jgi:D-glycero-D-manno-heptose 1,7-bisphosphate phosphatase